MKCSAARCPVKDRTDLIQWDNLLEGKFLEEARPDARERQGRVDPSPCPSRRRPTPKMLGAISSMANMGYDVTEADKLIPLAFDAIREDRLIDLQVLNARVFKALAEAPKIEGHPYWSCVVYESFEQYLQNAQLCEYPDYRLPGREELFDRVHAGWLGEIIGSALGTAVEGFKSSRLWEVFGEIDGYVKPPRPSTTTSPSSSRCSRRSVKRATRSIPTTSLTSGWAHPLRLHGRGGRPAPHALRASIRRRAATSSIPTAR